MLLYIGIAVVTLLLGAIYFLSERVPEYDFKGKNVVITGGSSGIGLATAELLITKGVKSIALLARTQKTLDEAKQKLEKQIKESKTNNTAKIYIYSVDVTQYGALCNVAKEYNDAAGSIDLLIASAGVSRPALFDDIPMDEFEWMTKINYLGIVATCKAVTPFMKKQKSGRIVLISSMAGLIGITGYSSYSPTKFAVRGFAEVLHMELKPWNIFVSVCNPPDVDTPMYEKEMKSKPKECIVMSEGSGLFSAEAIATDICNGIHNYKFFIQSGFVGELLGLVASGSMPSSNFVQSLKEIGVMSLFRLINLFVRYDFDSVAAKVHKERQAGLLDEKKDQ